MTRQGVVLLLQGINELNGLKRQVLFRRWTLLL